MSAGHLSPSFSATLRLKLQDAPGTFAKVADAIGAAGGLLGAIDIVRVERGYKIRDVTVSAGGDEHLHAIAEAARSVDGVEVLRVSDRTFLMHLGGKIEIRSKVPLKTRDDLSMAYTPGVARICQAIADRTGLPVLAGPVEATAIGNVLVQARTAGLVGPQLADLRALVARTQGVTRFEPRG